MESASSQNPEKTSLESRLLAIGISAAGGIGAGLITRFADNQIDSNMSLIITQLSLGTGYAVSAAYLAFCKGDVKERVEALKNQTINYGTLAASCLGTYFV